MEKKGTVTSKAKPAYQYAVGRRKTSTARVRFYEDATQPAGTIMVNDKPASEYFAAGEYTAIEQLMSLNTNALDGYFTTKVVGGGKNAQAHAVRHGIARLFAQMYPDLRPLMKQRGFLTRDPRMKERKKPGLKRARRAPQWSKR
jgi:small subunit ribosomal protein S9